MIHRTTLSSLPYLTCLLCIPYRQARTHSYRRKEIGDLFPIQHILYACTPQYFMLQ